MRKQFLFEINIRCVRYRDDEVRLRDLTNK